MSPLPKKARFDEIKRLSSKHIEQRIQNDNYQPKVKNPSRINGNQGKKLRNKSFIHTKSKSNSLSNAKSTISFNQLPLDRINLEIIAELLTEGDIKSSEIATRLKVPLSTIQRRRARIEKYLLKKTYQIELSRLGFRMAHIFVDIQGGKVKETGEHLLKKYDKNVVRASTRINSTNNLCLEIVYNGSDELHYLLEEIKALPVATKVDWSEQVMIIGDNLATIIKNALSDKLGEVKVPKIIL